ncbi:MAG: hypothetical protein R3E68_16120 [Burkholderiaceae bacterium]
MPAARVQDCVRELREAGYEDTAVIGRILPAGDALEPIVLRA